MKEQVAAVRSYTGKPGARIGIVRIGEVGHYVSYLDRPEWTDGDVDDCIRRFNRMLGVPEDVAESAMAGSMFGWHTPAARRAIEFFEAREAVGQ